MKFTMGFFKTTAICIALCAITTLGVQLLPGAFPVTHSFDEMMPLHANPIHMSHLWVIFTH